MSADKIEACIDDCMKQETDLSPECASCFGTQAACVVNSHSTSDRRQCAEDLIKCTGGDFGHEAISAMSAHVRLSLVQNDDRVTEM